MSRARCSYQGPGTTHFSRTTAGRRELSAFLSGDGIKRNDRIFRGTLRHRVVTNQRGGLQPGAGQIHMDFSGVILPCDLQTGHVFRRHLCQMPLLRTCPPLGRPFTVFDLGGCHGLWCHTVIGKAPDGVIGFAHHGRDHGDSCDKHAGDKRHALDPIAAKPGCPA